MKMSVYVCNKLAVCIMKCLLDMCRFNQSSYEVEEGDEVDLFLSFTRALSADMDIRMEYNYSEAIGGK